MSNLLFRDNRGCGARRGWSCPSFVDTWRLGVQAPAKGVHMGKTKPPLPARVPRWGGASGTHLRLVALAGKMLAKRPAGPALCGCDVTVHGPKHVVSWNGAVYKGVRLTLVPTIGTKRP